MPIAENLINPGKFYRLSVKCRPWLGLSCLTFCMIGLYLAFFLAPADYLQGQSVRIMFVHVPAAWLSMAIYAVMSFSALGVLIWRHPLADIAQRAAAPIGAGFTLIALITGALWGKPTWGVYWVWDARLTSVLILLVIYLGLITIADAIEDPVRASRIVAIATLFGAVNLPVIKFSVDWWNTLHQPASLLRMGGPTIHPVFLWPLLIMALGFFLIFLWLQTGAIQNEILRQKIKSRYRMLARDDRHSHERTDEL